MHHAVLLIIYGMDEKSMPYRLKITMSWGSPSSRHVSLSGVLVQQFKAMVQLHIFCLRENTRMLYYLRTAFNIKITIIALPSDWLPGAYHHVNHTLFLPVA